MKRILAVLIGAILPLTVTVLARDSLGSGAQLTLAEMPTDPAARERALRAAVRRVDAMDTVRGQGHGELHVALADIEAAKGRWRSAAQLAREGLRLGPHTVGAGLKLVEFAWRASEAEQARAHLADLARFSTLAEAGSISDVAARLGLPDPFRNSDALVDTSTPLLSRPVSLLALGAIDQRDIEAIARLIERAFGQRVIVSTDANPPQPRTRDIQGVRQVDAAALWRQIKPIYSDALGSHSYAARIVIVPDDIFVRGLNFVWATMVDTGASVISTARFAHEDPMIARARVAKQVLRSVLDQNGAPRASHPACVNANVLTVDGFDALSDAICAESRVAILNQRGGG